MELIEIFNQSVAASKTLPEKPGNETLLNIYSLYKQATTGDAPAEADYGIFDFVAKAKHEAWKKHIGMTKEEAMQQYIDLISGLQKE